MKKVLLVLVSSAAIFSTIGQAAESGVRLADDALHSVCCGERTKGPQAVATDDDSAFD